MTPLKMMESLTREMILRAADELLANRVQHEFHESERYDVIIDERRHPPKAIIGVACSYLVGGRILRPREFRGGRDTPCFNALANLGFEIVPKFEPIPKMFHVGKHYNRSQDIHGKFKGQERGGITTPAGFPFVFAFSGSSGEQFGYYDGFRESDGIYLFTGEGKIGDMKMNKGNRAIRDAHANGKRILLFTEVRDGIWCFEGECDCLGHFESLQPDKEKHIRKAFVFEFAIRSPTSSPEAVEEPTLGSVPQAIGKSLKELRAQALLAASDTATTDERRQTVRIRSEAVRRYVLKRAKGVCKGCDEPAPFKTRQGQPYLEPHHTRRLADGGPDHPSHVIALCPNCHRRAHYADDAGAFNASLIELLKGIDPED